MRAERKARNLSQADLAKALNAVTEQDWHTTTIAKIEAGERSVRIDEAAAIADIFELSLDGFLGRNKSPRETAMYSARALSGSISQATYQLGSIHETLRDRVADLQSAAPPQGWLRDFADKCDKACDKVREAQAALDDTVSRPQNATLKRFLRRSLMAELEKEERDDEA